MWWDEPGYVVAFTTRVGGVSDGVARGVQGVIGAVAG